MRQRVGHIADWALGRVRGRGWLKLFLMCSVLAVCVLTPGRATANPDLRWRSLTTEHFVIHYQDQLAEVADRVALQAERAYEDVGGLFGHVPRQRTHVVIVDDTDLPNGSATAVPFPRITLHATAPDSMSVLGGYDDWLNILVTHEFVHVAHLDTSSGFPELFNKIFGLGGLGKVYSPNTIQPRWIIEGIATFYESDLGSQGRDRFAQFEMYLRMAVLEDRLESLSQITNGARIFPYGSAVYLYGLHFMKYLVLTYGRDTFMELSKLYGSRMIPFGINRALEDVIGVGFDDLWSDFLAAARRRYLAQGRQIRTRGLRQGRRLTFSSNAATSRNHTRYPVWSDDDRWIYYFEDDGHSRPGIRRIPRRGARLREGVGIGAQGQQDGVERIYSAPQATPISFIGDGPAFVYDMMGVHELRYRWSDLYRWQPGADPLDGGERLTFGLRAREPDVSPDGRTVVFARNDVAQSRLAFLDLRTKQTTEVGASERFEQVYTPRFSPDGRTVAYGVWREGGYRDIHIYDMETAERREVTLDRASDQSPCWSPDGRTLFFTSDRTGVFNIHAIDIETGEVWQVTNVLGGAFECAVSHDGSTLAYVGFAGTGFDLWSMPIEPETWTPAVNGDLDYPVAPDFRAPESPAPESLATVSGVTGAEEKEEEVTPKSARYRPIKTLFPRVVMPTAFEFSSSDFLSDIGVSTEVADVVGLHRLSGTFRWLVNYGRPAGSVQWSWRRPFPTLSAGFGRTYRERGGYDRYIYDAENSDLYLSSQYLERSTQATAQLSVPVISHPIHRASASVDYRFTRYQNLDETSVVDPNAPAQTRPEVGDLAGMTMRLGYSNTRSNQFSYYSETGRRLSLSVGVFDRALGGDFSDLQARLTYAEFIPMPWRGHQVLALRLSGGASAGGLERRGAFALGGMAEQQDQLRLILTRTVVSEAGALRGYPAGVFRGRYFGLLSAEYRIPLVDIERGVGAVPMYLQNVVLVPFTDWGRAWTDPIAWRDLAGSVGASLIFSFRVGYGERVDLFFQYARGLDAEIGLDTFRLMVARSF